MNKNEASVLRKLGFHVSNDNGKQHLPWEAKGWSRRFGRGLVTTVLYVRKSAIGFEYRIIVSDKDTAKDTLQCFNAEELRQVRKQFRNAERLWKKARRGLEGTLARRTLRWLVQ